MAGFDTAFWADRHGGGPLGGAVNPQLAALAPSLSTGTALDVGCGRGASALWLAARGWQVTGVDVVEAPLLAAARAAEEQGLDAVTSWQRGDLLGGWRPVGPEEGWTLVTSFHVHPDGPMEQFVGRMADLVAPGGTLLVVGHHATDRARESAPADPSIEGHALARPLAEAGWAVDTRTEAIPATGEAGHGHGRIDVVVTARRPV